MSIVSILLGIDVAMLAIVVVAYMYSSVRERKFLRQEANHAVVLQQRIYQAEVLRELNERIGYSLDTNKIVEIITSSLGNLLHYDTVSYMVVEENGNVRFKCQVENSVTHGFIEQVREKMLQANSLVLGKEIKPSRVDESITGNILDDSLKVELESYFNLPVVISGKLVGLINVASGEPGRYGEDQSAIFYSIINQAATTVTKLQSVLETEKGKLSAIIYSLADGVITLDLGHNLLVWNPAVREILEIGTDKPLTIFDIVDALAGKVDLRTKVDQAIVENKLIEIPDVMLKNKALELAITPVKNPEGETVGVSVVFHDITTEKSLEKVRQEFTAMMVHELRAPLTAVRWSSESLIKNLAQAAGTDPAKLKETAVTIETASNNMLELVNDLLDVAKIESGKFELNLQENDLAAVVGDQVKMFQQQAAIKHLDINVTAPQSLKLKFDKVRISQVLGNLLSNAIKYTDAGHIEVNISGDPSAKFAAVAIKDSGIGIAREDLGDLFSKFKQLKSEHARKGTGLGLVVCKGIIDAHGGKIWAESEGENMGSTFIFTLPAEA